MWAGRWVRQHTAQQSVLQDGQHRAQAEGCYDAAACRQGALPRWSHVQHAEWRCEQRSLVKKRYPRISLPSLGLTGWMWVRRYRVAEIRACRLLLYTTWHFCAHSLGASNTCMRPQFSQDNYHKHFASLAGRQLPYS